MKPVVSVGKQEFSSLRENGYFYIDKTDFIKEWWEAGDDVTLITRPRCFGKTLNMSMLECFFSLKYKDRSDLFEGLNIWKEEKYRELQGTYPVIFLSFADVKQGNYKDAVKKLKSILAKLYDERYILVDWEGLTPNERKQFLSVSADMDDVMLCPLKEEEPTFVLEFKVHDEEEEKNLRDTVAAALAQIEEMQYNAKLLERGVKPDNIRHYGFAFEGKKVLIG